MNKQKIHQMNCKNTHYRLHKRGKHWLVTYSLIGIVTGGVWLGQNTRALGAETDATMPVATSTTSETNVSAKQVTLHGEQPTVGTAKTAESLTESTNKAASSESQTDKTNVATTNNSTSNMVADKSTPTGKTHDQVKSVESSETATENSTPSANSIAKPSSTMNEQVSEEQSDNNTKSDTESARVTTAPVTDQATNQEQLTKQVSPNVDSTSTSTDTQKLVKQPEKPVAESKQSSQTAMASRTLSSKVKTSQKGNLTIDTGTWGTAQWNYDEDSGLLTIGGGQVDSSSYLPWLHDAKEIRFQSKLTLPVDCGWLFSDLKATKITGANYLDTSKVTNMKNMFARASVLSTLDVSGWDTSQVTNMSGMFAEDSQLIELKGINSWDTAKVTDMSIMFQHTGLTTLDLSAWDTTNVTSMLTMFTGAKNLTSLNVSSWNTGNVTDMRSMFYNTTSLTDLKGIGSWDTSKVTSMAGMFDATGLNKLDLGSWNTSNVTDMSIMFYNSSNLSQLVGLDKWNTSKVTDMDGMFMSTGLTNLDLSSWNTTNVTDMSGMFFNMNKLSRLLGLNKWDTSGLISMVSMFRSTGLTSLDLSSWDTANVTDMRFAFTNTDLRTLILGTKSIFNDTIGLAEIDPQSKNTDDVHYTGKWIYLADAQGTPIENGATYTSSQLMNTYNGTQPGKYVWQTLAGVQAKDSQLIAGPKATWDKANGFIEATDAAGRPVDVNQITVNGLVDPTKVGKYLVHYQYVDINGNVMTQAATVTVIASQAGIKTKNTQLIAGPKTTWQGDDNFVNGTDANGKTLSLSQVKVNGAVYPMKPGQYKVTYSYTDVAGNKVNQTATITVVASQTGIKTKDTKLIAGPKTTWQASDNFVSGSDINGKPLGLSQVKVSGTVDPTKVGQYKVIYSYTDAVGNKVNQTATVTVVASQTGIKTKDTQLIAGPKSKWQASDNFVSGSDINGKPLGLSQVKVSGTVDPTKAGQYKVIYSYTDVAGNKINQTATITVVASQTGIKTKDTKLIAGPKSKWQASDNFVSGSDINGKPLGLSQVKVSGTVDPTKAGQYKVIYSYTDVAGNKINQTATITVVASQTGIKTKDTKLIAGPKSKWQASDNFVSGSDINGKPLGLSQVKVSGTVDPTKAGQYKVIYSYTDVAGNKINQTATITVVASQAGIKTKDTQLIAGPKTTWQADDNFVSGSDAQGQSLDLSQIKVVGVVNAKKAGRYSITYNYTDTAGNTINETAIVMVIASHVEPAEPTEPNSSTKPNESKQPTEPAQPVKSNQSDKTTQSIESDDPNQAIQLVVSKKYDNSNQGSQRKLSSQDIRLTPASQKDMATTEQSVDKQHLPQTSETNQHSLTISGILMVVLSSVWGLFGLHKRQR